MKCPTELSHKPILVVDDYDAIDGPYAHNTDAMALSLGKSQFDGTTISAKVFRQVKGRWSRQSEELPLHRVLDLAILIAATANGKTSHLKEHLGDTESAKSGYAAVLSALSNKEILDRFDELKRLL